MGLAYSKIPVCIPNIAQKSLHPVFSLLYAGRHPNDIIVEENQKTCYNRCHGITLYDEVHVPENSVFSRVFRHLIVMILFSFLLTNRPVLGLSC